MVSELDAFRKECCNIQEVAQGQKEPTDINALCDEYLLTSIMVESKR
ncbi:MAG: hypothetical protein IPN31_01835 [Bacteroidetes bacterium]|nr:hypothetical protein [Bacteroidota bacterium]